MTTAISSKTAQLLLTYPAEIVIMGYRAALNLAKIAQGAKLLDDDLVKNTIRAVAVADNPKIERVAETYIGIRALENMFSGYRRNYRQG